jgi:hypothetical protein
MGVGGGGWGGDSFCMNQLWCYNTLFYPFIIGAPSPDLRPIANVEDVGMLITMVLNFDQGEISRL